MADGNDMELTCVDSFIICWSLKFQIAENILHGIQGLMKLFFSKSGLNSWRYPTSWFASLFRVFRSFSVAFVLRTVTLLEIDKT